MIDCPECLHSFHSGTKCPSCGYEIRRQHIPRHDPGIDVCQGEAHQWLLRNGVISEDMSPDERKKAMHEYRQSILRKPKKLDRSWAKELLARDDRGYMQDKLASEALSEVVDEDL